MVPVGDPEVRGAPSRERHRFFITAWIRGRNQGSCSGGEVMLAEAWWNFFPAGIDGADDVIVCAGRGVYRACCGEDWGRAMMVLARRL